jgi:Ca2+-binding RTX toxin-like protein
MRRPVLWCAVLLCLGTVAIPSVAEAGTPECFGRAPTITGTPLGDTLIGTNEPDVIVGLGGRDFIKGLGGGDRICGGGVRDRIRGGSGHDRLAGQRGDDLLKGGEGRDLLRAGIGGGEWPNELLGGSGDDRLIGGREGDLFWMGPGDDKAVGHADEDTNLSDALYFTRLGHGVTVNMTTHTVTGQGHDSIRGIDEVHGSRHSDVLIGDEDTNYLSGECTDAYAYCEQRPRRGAGDVIKGKAGGDVLDGSAGRDRVFGGRGDDLVFGGFGKDTCRGEDLYECENH